MGQTFCYRCRLSLSGRVARSCKAFLLMPKRVGCCLRVFWVKWVGGGCLGVVGLFGLRALMTKNKKKGVLIAPLTYRLKPCV